MIKTARGFTLIEMAIVLVIITILIGGLAVPLSAQIQARRIAETKKIMEEAREAIVGYAMTHTCTCAYDTVGPTGNLQPAPQTTCTTINSCPNQNPSSTAVTLKHAYLPCPDADGDGNGDDNRNLASRACSPSAGGLAHGWLPWVELGVAQQDAWGNRLLYAVNTVYSNELSGFSSSTALANPLQVCTTSTCVTPDVASNVVFLLVSHGANGWGALNVNGNTLAEPTGADELENKDLTPDSKYVSRTPTQVGGPGGEFDDLLVWVSDSLLKARVCPTGSDCSP
ncbi:MAG: prepilin-type N-terminal cleavage/methylation domain-containing protein [Thiobacillus sp.]|nr:prepilin-type N-terminal cleavage/methylation domain-containing protein [Thiobacillus sp.]